MRYNLGKKFHERINEFWRWAKDEKYKITQAEYAPFVWYDEKYSSGLAARHQAAVCGGLCPHCHCRI